MACVFVDESEWPVVMVRWPADATNEEIGAHFDYMLVLLARGEPFVVIVDMDSIRRQSAAKRKLAGARLAELEASTSPVLVAVAYVADHWLARAVLTTITWMSPPPFPTREFRTVDKARQWGVGMLRQATDRWSLAVPPCP